MHVSEYQQLVAKLVKERGFQDEKVHEVFTLMVEEVGELAKALRKSNGQKVDKNSKQYDIEEELADVMFMLLDLSNRLNVDLEAAFAAKETKNQQRTWG